MLNLSIKEKPAKICGIRSLDLENLTINKASYSCQFTLGLGINPLAAAISAHTV